MLSHTPNETATGSSLHPAPPRAQSKTDLIIDVTGGGGAAPGTVSLPEVDVLGHPITVVNRPGLETLIDLAIRTRSRLAMVSVNLHWLTLIGSNPEHARLADTFEVRLIDGTPVKWLAAMAAGCEVDKHAGSDLVPELCRLSAERGYRIVMLGAAPGVADRAAAKAIAAHPGCRIVGTASPTREVVNDSEASARLCDAIAADEPDIVLVALGMPLQEEWIARHRDRIGAPIIMGVGASFDFLAGEVERAPRLVQRAGGEWLWRLMREPRRLWRRYLVEDRPAAVATVRMLVTAKLGRVHTSGIRRRAVPIGAKARSAARRRRLSVVPPLTEARDGAVSAR